jgi:3'(2'), 5'-bisphosphate nucleotidase
MFRNDKNNNKRDRLRNKMIKKVINVIEKAGFEILKIYYSNEFKNNNFKIEIKKDKEASPLTKADLKSNTIIINGLNSFSKYPIITEESYVEYETRKKWKKFWLVDPLDGTKNFIARDGEFTINIALIQKNKPVLGVVYAPAFKLIYWAIKDKGAFKNGKKIFNNSKRKDIIGAESRFHSNEKSLKFFKKNNIKIIKKYGSALKLCKLAEGEIDVYPRLNGTKEWDTAAGHIILKESGCKIIDIISGKELVYNKKNIENNYFIASRSDLKFNF